MLLLILSSSLVTTSKSLHWLLHWIIHQLLVLISAQTKLRRTYLPYYLISRFSAHFRCQPWLSTSLTSAFMLLPLHWWGKSSLSKSVKPPTLSSSELISVVMNTENYNLITARQVVITASDCLLIAYILLFWFLIPPVTSYFFYTLWGRDCNLLCF